MYSRHSQHLLVDCLERIDALLEVDVVRGKLGLITSDVSMGMWLGR